MLRLRKAAPRRASPAMVRARNQPKRLGLDGAQQDRLLVALAAAVLG